MRLARTFVYLVATLAVPAAACSADPEPAQPGSLSNPSDAAGMAAAESAERADPEAARKAAMAARREAIAKRQQRAPLAGIELTADQQRRLAELPEAQAKWRAEHEGELKRLRQQIAAARRSGDPEALAAAQDRLARLRRSAPSSTSIFEDLSAEQRAQMERNLRKRKPTQPSRDETEAEREQRLARQKARLEQRREERFAGVGLSEDQQRRIDELGAARRAWNEQNREQLRALRTDLRAARQAGDTATAEQLAGQLEALKATAPEITDIFAELSEEQRAQIRRNRPDRKGAVRVAPSGDAPVSDAAAADAAPSAEQPAPTQAP